MPWPLEDDDGPDTRGIVERLEDVESVVGVSVGLLLSLVTVLLFLLSISGEGVLLDDTGIPLVVFCDLLPDDLCGDDSSCIVVLLGGFGVTERVVLITGMPEVVDVLVILASAEALRVAVLPPSVSSSSSGSSLMDDDIAATEGGNFSCSLMCLARFSDDEKVRSEALLVCSLPGLEYGSGGLELLIDALGNVYE